MTHINEVHGAEAVNGMAGLMAWCQAPTRALGRFDAGQPPKTLDEMYACATNEFERSTITDLLFGSVTDVLDRYLPDKEKHGALRGMLSLLAVNTTYRGPATPGTAAALAYGFAVPDENALLVKKLRGGIGALTSHLCDVFTSNGGELRLRSKVEEILVADGRVSGVRLEDGSTHHRAGRRLRHRTGPHAQPAGRRGRGARRRPGAVLPRRPPRQLSADALRARRRTGIRGALRIAQRSRHAVEHRHLQHARGIAAAVGGLQARHRARRSRPSRCRSRRSTIPAWRRRASMRRRRSRCGSRSRRATSSYGEMKVEMGQRVIEKITRLAPNFESLIIRHTTFTPKHMGTMFGAPGGDYCHGLIHPDQIGINRPGPKGYVDQPIPIDGLYLGERGLPRRTRHHVHPRLQRRAGGAAPTRARRLSRPSAAPPSSDQSAVVGALGRVALDVRRALGAGVRPSGLGVWVSARDYPRRRARKPSARHRPRRGRSSRAPSGECRATDDSAVADEVHAGDEEKLFGTNEFEPQVPYRRHVGQLLHPRDELPPAGLGSRVRRSGTGDCGRSAAPRPRRAARRPGSSRQRPTRPRRSVRASGCRQWR